MDQAEGALGKAEAGDNFILGQDVFMRGNMETRKHDEKDILKAPQDDLWSRIKALAEKEDISYLEATERCVKEYWKDYGLTKES